MFTNYSASYLIFTNFALNHFGYLLRASGYISLVFTFDHYPRQRLSSRITQKQPAPITERSLDFVRQFLNRRQFFERYFLADTNIHKYLRKPLESFGELAQALVLMVHYPQEVDRRDHPVTCETDLRKDNVPRLFTAECSV